MIDFRENYLAIHAGHTRIKFGLFEFRGCPPLPLPQTLATGSIENEDSILWSEIEAELGDLTGAVPVVTGSNQEQISKILSNWSPTLPQPVLISEKRLIPIQAMVDVPEKVGADRLLNAVAVNLLRSSDRAAIVVDSGTAITVDLISRQGDFHGGAILPGVLMGAKALHDYTTTLPLIDGREFLNSAPPAIGRNTEAAMASGLYWGHLGGVKELVQRISLELAEVPHIYLTGGASPLLQPYLSHAILEPHLSLIGTVITARTMRKQSQCSPH